MAEAQMTTAQAVEKAIRLAQDAVKADESGNIEAAIDLYVQSVELIKLGLQVSAHAHTHTRTPTKTETRAHTQSLFVSMALSGTPCAHTVSVHGCMDAR